MLTKISLFNRLRKNQRNTTEIFSRKGNDLIKMAEYEEARVKLTNTQLNKLKSGIV